MTPWDEVDAIRLIIASFIFKNQWAEVLTGLNSVFSVSLIEVKSGQNLRLSVVYCPFWKY